MNHRAHHIPLDRLTALAFASRVPGDDSVEAVEDERALAHVAECSQCAATLSTLAADAEAVRDLAFVEADTAFDDAMLDAQRTRILDRLAHLGQAARVLAFPSRTREAAMVGATGSRRWISVAAAAGLIIGLVAGQMLHFVPSTASLREDTASMRTPSAQSRAAIVPASASVPALTEDELLEEVDAAIQLRQASALSAIDALTPTAADLLAGVR